MTTPAAAARFLRSRADGTGPAVARLLHVAAATIEVLPSSEARAEAAATLRRVVGAFELRAGAEARVADLLLDFARDLDPAS